MSLALRAVVIAGVDAGVVIDAVVALRVIGRASADVEAVNDKVGHITEVVVVIIAAVVVPGDCAAVFLGVASAALGRVGEGEHNAVIAVIPDGRVGGCIWASRDDNPYSLFDRAVTEVVVIVVAAHVDRAILIVIYVVADLREDDQHSAVAEASIGLVGVCVVALFAVCCLGDSVSADRCVAGVRAEVIVDSVAVITLFAGIDDTVSAGRRLDITKLIAAISGDGVPVVALFHAVLDVVSAEAVDAVGAAGSGRGV
jgi:hypothetical protein